MANYVLIVGVGSARQRVHLRRRASPPASPSAATPGSSAHPSGPPPLAYSPSSAAPRHTFSCCSATSLGHTFAPPSGSGPSAEPSLDADIMPRFLAHTFTRGSPARLRKNK